MSVTINAKGTSVSTFAVGKDGTTISQAGAITPPNGNNLTVVLAEDNFLNIDAGISGPSVITTTDDKDLHINPAVGGGQYLVLNSVRWPVVDGINGQVLQTNGAGVLSFATLSGTGTVTNVSVQSANGFAGSVATPTTTPAITLSTTVTGVLKGNGTAISAATPGTDYLTVLTGDATTTGNALTLATVNSGIGQYAVGTFNAKGLVTSATDLLATGDATGMSSGASIALTLATVNSNVGSFGAASSVGTFTVNAKGLITAAGNTSIQIAETQITDGAILARVGANETITGSWTFNNPVVGATPTLGSHLTTKNYVDDVASGLNVHQAVRAATISALTATYDNGAAGVGATLTGTGVLPAIDGVTLAVSNRVLVKSQSTQLQNGIYVVTQTTANWILTRTSDFDNSPVGEVVAGDSTFIQEGTLAGTQWVMITSGTITIGSSNIVFTQFGGPGTYTAGDGLTLSGTTFNVGTASSSRIVVNVDDIDLAAVTDSGSGTFLKLTRDSYGRVSGTTAVVASDITGLVDSTYVNVAGDTMTGLLTNQGAIDAVVQSWTKTASNTSLRVQVKDDVTANTASFRLYQDWFGNGVQNGYIDFLRGADGATGHLAFGTSGTSRLTIGSAGNVSIAAPGSGTPLTVNGSGVTATGTSGQTVFLATTTDTAGSARVQITADGANNSQFAQYGTATAGSFITGVPLAGLTALFSPAASTGFLISQQSTTAPLIFATNATERMRITGAGVIQDGSGLEIGYKNVPRNTTAGGLDGQCTAVTAGFTLNTGLPAGTTRSFYNDSASSITITQGSGLTLYGTAAATGNRTLAARGMCTIWANTTTVYKITGEIT